MTPTRRTALAAAALFASAGAAFAQDVLVVAPADLASETAAWKAHRERQGHKVTIRPVPVDGGAEAIAALVRGVHKESRGSLRFVLVLGDADRVPCAYAPVVATAQWETDTRIATDLPFADPDGDGVPDLAVGRVPADSPAEARALLGRSIEYETNRDFGEWRRRLAVVAGTGGFGPLQDAALEAMTKGFLTRDVPPSVVVSGTYGNPLSAWCPPPREFADTVVSRINDGALFVAYIGHGSAHEVDRVRVGRERFPILGPPEVARIDVQRGAPILAFIACSTGRFDGDRDCLGEEILRRPRGPVAVIASSRVSTPYGNGILSREMLVSAWKDRAATTGELLLAMKRRLVEPAGDDPSRVQIEKLAAGFYQPDEKLRAADRAEHLALYNLLGDPCVRIARPADLLIDAPESARPGGAVVVTGTAPSAGRLLVEVTRRRDAVVPLGARKTADDYRATYAAANSLAVTSATAAVGKGPFRVELTIPAETKPGPCCVRAWFEGDGVGAAGGRAVEVVAAPAPAPGDGK